MRIVLIIWLTVFAGEHGEWLPWLEKNISFSQKTAWRYMELYKQKAKLGTVPNLTDAYHRLGVKGGD
jgi:hypothetical protein